MPRKFTAAFKFEVVRQVTTGEKRLAQVCREHDLDPTTVRDWRTQVERKGTAAFPNSHGEEAVLPAAAGALTLAVAEARIGELERLVGQLALENDFLKKALRRVNSPASKGSA